MWTAAKTTSYIAFYNFGEVGQNEDDRIVSGYTYDGVVVPQIQYLGSNAVALRMMDLPYIPGARFLKN